MTVASNAFPLPPEHNVEMRWDQVDPDAYLVPNDRFFVRSHSVAPRISPTGWRLRIEGPGVRRTVEVTYDELLARSSVTIVRALECAGNGRAHFASAQGRTPPGHPWGFGAIGVAEWTGVPLGSLLERAGLTPAAREVVPEGLDELRVRRPLPRDKARAEDTLVAVAMNGEPLPIDHGFPARLIVPGWAAVASIKWLGRILVPDRPIHTWWNTTHYVLRGPAYPRRGPGRGEVITKQVMKSAIELPWPARVPPGFRTVWGRSWSPTGSIRRVEVSVNSGPWQRAYLREPNLPGAWVRWWFPWDPAPGSYGIRVRAMDHRGVRQPDNVPWNERGYLYGAVVSHPVEVEPPTVA